MSKKIDKTLYTESSISTETPREFTRRVPSTYLGSARTNTNLIKELYANSIDEYEIGHGNVINVVIDTKKNVYSVEDFGQGFLINAGIDEDGETILQRCFDKINTSGKTSEDGVYQGTALGLNGIGAKLTNWLSLSLHVDTYRDNQCESLDFKDGIFLKREVKDVVHESGTKVIWSPDPQFFKNNEPDMDILKQYFEEISALCTQLTTNLLYNGESYSFNEPNGLNALLDKRISNKELLSNRFNIKRQSGSDSLNICITYTSDYSENINAYVNLGYTDSGAHITAFRIAFIKALNKYANDNNIIKKNEKNLTSAEVSEGLTVIFNMKTTSAKYEAQNKRKIDDIDGSIINQVMNNDFYDWLTNNPKDAKLIIDRALLARRAREASQKAKEGVRNAKAKSKKFIDLPTKLVDAYSKNRSECELYICEGDSAANGLIAKRDGKTQAIFPIRGKILSCRKASVEKIYANQEISNIVKALGLDIIKDTGKLVYDKKKLRYDKIILAADADPDGFDIKLLLINVFWWLCPELVINGHLYAAIPPLYRITTKKNEYIYLTDDKELNEYKKKHKSESFLVNRNKGLGEQDSNELKVCLLNPSTRNVQQIVVNDADEADRLLEIFMGTDVPPRRDYLLEHCSEIEIDVE